jgi:ribonuclease D
VAIDTEFMCRSTYYPVLCLLQINVNGSCYAIDVMEANIDLRPFFKILNNKSIIKIFHCATQDLEVFANHAKNIPIKFSPKSIVDTQLMANFCGFKYNIGYAALVKHFLNIDLSKALQKSNWALRPLRQEQVEYALDDVLYLTNIYQLMKVELSDGNKFDWFLRESKVTLRKSRGNNKPDLCNKFFNYKKKNYHLENIKLMVLWRDNLAKLHNVPRSFILKDKSLDYISRIEPKTTKDFQEIDIHSRISKSKIKKEIIDLLHNKIGKKGSNFLKDLGKKLMKFLRNYNNKILHNNANFRMNKTQEDLYNKAKILLLNKSTYHNLSPELITNQNNLKQIILNNKKARKKLSGWRFIVYGKDLYKLLNTVG